MLTRTELSDLERSLRGTATLTVYLESAAADPAERTAWRRRLTEELDAVRRALRDAAHAEREAFERAVTHLEARLDGTDERPPSHGWVGLVTPDGVRHAAALPVPVPTLVAWGDGMRIAPYLRALAPSGPVTVAVADSRKVRIYSLRDGVLEAHGTLHARAHVGPVTHMGGPPRPGFHTGTRGAAGTDAADRALLAGRERMLRELAERLVDVAGPEGWILVGGIPEVATAALGCLPHGLRGRTRQVDGLDVHATPAEIAARAGAAVSELRQEDSMAAVGEALDRYGAGGAAAIQREGVLEALRQGAVDRLYLSERFLHDDPITAEQAVRAAFDQDADVTFVDAPAAGRLDSEARGVAARLRFAPTRGQAPLTASPSPALPPEAS